MAEKVTRIKHQVNEIHGYSMGILSDVCLPNIVCFSHVVLAITEQVHVCKQFIEC